MRRSVLHWICVLALVSFATGCGDESTAAGGSGGTGGEVASEIAQARAATERYKSLENAIEDGYVPNSRPCLAYQGWRYSNDAYVLPALSGTLDIEKPVTLVYDREVDGEMTLMAVEYIAPGEGDAPVIFGHEMDGTFCLEGLPPLYVVFVWLWRDNPCGMFELGNWAVGPDVCVVDGMDLQVPPPVYCETNLPPPPPEQQCPPAESP